MDRKNLVWILMFLLLVLLGVVKTTEPLTDLEYIAGKLVFYQIEGNDTYVRNSRQLASDVPTEAVFEFYGLQKNFSTEQCIYTWDLGNGEVIQGTEPVVRYHYPQSGNYTLYLKVGINVTKHGPLSTGVYSTVVQVLDSVKQIKMKETSYYEVSQNTTLDFYVDGSPPMWVCWSFLPNCVEDATGGCTLSMLYENTLRLSHTFNSAGLHCLDISIRNDISKLHTSFSLDVRRNYDIHMFFILLCAAVLVATISYVAVVTCRSRHQNSSQIAASSNATFLTDQDCDGQNTSLLNFSAVERSDKEPLLLQYGTLNSS